MLRSVQEAAIADIRACHKSLELHSTSFFRTINLRKKIVRYLLLCGSGCKFNPVNYS